MRACQASQDWREARETKETSGLQVRLCRTCYCTHIHVGVLYESLWWSFCTGQPGRPGEKGIAGLPGSAGDTGSDGRPGKEQIPARYPHQSFFGYVHSSPKQGTVVQ